MTTQSLSPPISSPLRRKGRANGTGLSNVAGPLAGAAAGPQSKVGATVVPAVVPAVVSAVDELRHALLIGAMPLIQLERLAGTLKARRGEVDDPRLAEVIEEIELRAAVELAKLGR